MAQDDSESASSSPHSSWLRGTDAPPDDSIPVLETA
jgi:hypothetical protein